MIHVRGPVVSSLSLFNLNPEWIFLALKKDTCRPYEVPPYSITNSTRTFLATSVCVYTLSPNPSTHLLVGFVFTLVTKSEISRNDLTRQRNTVKY